MLVTVVPGRDERFTELSGISMPGATSLTASDRQAKRGSFVQPRPRWQSGIARALAIA